MKQKLLLVFSFFLASISMVAQDSNDKKFSVEASYPKSINDGFLSDGILDLGLKYRFVDLKIAKLGVGINGSMYTDNNEDNPFGNPTKTKNYFIQPKVFGEFTIPGAEKFKTNLGLGYSFVKTKIDGTSSQVGDYTNSFDDKGFNLNLGVSYDISKSFFVQLQYDIIFREENFQGYKIGDFSTIKLGVGFRF